MQWNVRFPQNGNAAKEIAAGGDKKTDWFQPK